MDLVLTEETKVTIVPVAFTGPARVGKDSTGRTFSREMSDCVFTDADGKSVIVKCRHYAFANSLKRAASEIFHIQLEDFSRDQTKEVNNQYWGMSPRKIAQLLGTEACRNTFGPDIWVKSVFYEIIEDAKHILKETKQSGFTNNVIFVPIITDCRFDNEAKSVIDHGGLVVQIKNSFHQAISESAHASEMGVSKELISLTIQNNFKDKLRMNDNKSINVDSIIDLFARRKELVAEKPIYNRSVNPTGTTLIQNCSVNPTGTTLIQN